MADTALIGQAAGVNKNLAELVGVIRTAFPLHSSTGTLTWAVAATKVVTDTSIKSGSIVLLMPTNAAAAAMVAGVHSPYVSARTAGTSFTLTTADGNAAAGTETFEYIAISIG
jgi:hypothetical protein